MLTILTPTYNRAYILKNAYDSLLRQTDHDFEWILVDDGSTDGTQALVEGWLREANPFPISYYRQENGGKHRAVNFGVTKAAGDYVLILDSDDYLTDDASEWIHRWIRDIDGLPGFAGVSGLKARRGAPIGGGLGRPFRDATNLERRKLRMMADMAEVYKTEILRQYPFPAFEGEKFLRESASWDRIAADGYRIRWYDRVIYECDYLEDGLTKNVDTALYVRNFQGYTYCTKLYLRTRTGLEREFMIGRFATVAEAAGCSDGRICALLEIKQSRLAAARGLYQAKEWIKPAVKRLLRR